MPDPLPTPLETTRATLLLRLRNDGPPREIAWHEFHDLYAPIIRGFARRMGARDQEAEDLLQEVMKSLFSAGLSYDPTRGRFRGYLKTCVWNKLREFRRRGSREISGVMDATPEPSDERVEDAWNDVWETEKLHRTLASVRLRYAANSDRPKTFRAFEMCTLLDRPIEQVAAELGLTTEGVRQAKSRVSRALKQAFDQLDDTTG